MFSLVRSRLIASFSFYPLNLIKCETFNHLWQQTPSLTQTDSESFFPSGHQDGELCPLTSVYPWPCLGLCQSFALSSIFAYLHFIFHAQPTHTPSQIITLNNTFFFLFFPLYMFIILILILILIIYYMLAFF